MSHRRLVRVRSSIGRQPIAHPSAPRPRTWLRVGVLIGLLLPTGAVLGLPTSSLAATGGATPAVSAPQLVSVTPSGAPSSPDSGNVDYWSVQASRDGTVVAFLSNDRGLDPTTTAAQVPTVYVRDMASGRTRLAAVSTSGAQFGSVNRIQLSGDGKHLVFMTLTGGRDTLYVRDLPTGTTEPLGNLGGGNFFSIDDTGRRVAVDATSTTYQSLIIDRQAGTSVTVPGKMPRLSGDGNHVVTWTAAQQVAEYNLVTGESALVSVATDGTTPGDRESSPFNAVSYDGRYVAFDSFAGNLVACRPQSPCAPSSSGRLYRRDMVSGLTSRVDVQSSGADPVGGYTYQGVDISADGQRVGFAASGDFGLAANAPSTQQLYVRNFVTGAIDLVSTGADGSPLPGGVTGIPHLIGDAAAAVFVAMSPSGNRSFQVFVTSPTRPVLVTPPARGNSGCSDADNAGRSVLTGEGAIVPGSTTADSGDTQVGGTVTFGFTLSCATGSVTPIRQPRITDTPPGKGKRTISLTPIDVIDQRISGVTGHLAGHTAIDGAGNYPFTIDATDGTPGRRADHIRITVYAARSDAKLDSSKPLYQFSGDATPGSTATISLVTAPTVTLQPAASTGRVGRPVTFTAIAQGAPAPTVQWQQSTDSGRTWTDLANKRSTTLSITPTRAQTLYRYRAVFTNTAGAAISAGVVLTVRD